MTNSSSSHIPHAVLSQADGVACQPKDFDWVAKNIPCQAACPADTDIPGYLEAIAQGQYDEAYAMNLRDNVFPAVLGRVCSRPCEAACRHGWEGLGEPVAICFSKRAADDHGKDDLVVLPAAAESGKSVAVVGAGVAGLAVARQLAQWGHRVRVLEKHERPGGMLNQGIPEFRLPRDIIDREIAQIQALGVEVVCGHSVGVDSSLAELRADHDAVVMAAGTLRPNIPSLPGSELAGIEHGLDFLLRVNEFDQQEIGRQVIVIGGGFTAMDCARVALRLATEHVAVYYRRSRDEMLVTEEELVALEQEDIDVSYMVTPVAYLGEEGRLTAVRFQRTELGEADENGRRRPIPVPDSEFEVAADTVLLATGQFPETNWIEDALQETLVSEQWLRSGKETQTELANVFVAGDFALGATTLIDAIGHAKDCALDVDQALMGRRREEKVVAISDVDETGRDGDLNARARHPMDMIPVSERSLTAEVETGFLSPISQDEAERCYLCHYKFEINNDLCIYCDGCLRVRPVDNCIVKLDSLDYDAEGRITGYQRASDALNYNILYIDQNECTRCGACADVCPVECITVQKVQAQSRCVV